MAINPEWNLQNLQAEIEGWLSRERNFIHDRARKTLSDYADGGPGRPVPISRQLSKLFSWHGAAGAVARLRGDDRGLEDLYRAHAYDMAFVRVRLAMLDERKAGTIDFNETALTLARSIALGCDDDADYVGRRLVDGLPNGLFDGVDGTRVGPFVLSLFLDWQQIRPLESVATPFHSIEGFAALLQVWRSADVERVRRAMEDAADMHTFRTGDPSEEDLPEFSDYVYRIWPVEIVAVAPLRETLGLIVPTSAHPLLATPLARLAPPQQPVTDDLLTRVLTRLHREIPTLTKQFEPRRSV